MKKTKSTFFDFDNHAYQVQYMLSDELDTSSG